MESKLLNLVEDKYFSPEITDALEALSVGSVMTRSVAKLHLGSDLLRVGKLLNKRRYPYIIVVDDYDRAIGYLTLFDLFSVLFVNEGRFKKKNNLGRLRVSNIYKRFSCRVTSNDNLLYAGNILMQNNLDCLPVMDGEEFLGILCDKDFFNIVNKAYPV